jgi:hypothetical protein
MTSRWRTAVTEALALPQLSTRVGKRWARNLDEVDREVYA